MTDLAGTMGANCADFLKREYPQHTAKRVARELEKVAPTPDDVPQIRTVESWLTGRAPINKHVGLMVKRWGIDFLYAYFAGLVTPPDQASLDQRLEEVERTIKLLKIEREGK